MAHALYKPLLMTSITASSVLSGCLFSLSYVSVAAILGPPQISDTLLLSMWKTVFLRGFHLCPTLAAFSGSCCFVNAFLTYRYEAGSVGLERGNSRVLPLLIAGSFMIGVIPFTLSVIVPLEEIMLHKEGRLAKARQLPAERENEGVFMGEVSRSDGSAAETRRLLKRWAKLNYGRTILPVVGALVSWSVW